MLGRLGLLQGVWRHRLARARPALIDFINRFYPVPSFDLVVRDYFMNPYQRRRARFLFRVARRLSERRRDFADVMSFERVLTVGPDGQPIREVDIKVDGTHYAVKSWATLQPRAVQKHFARELLLRGGPERIRWIFDGRRLGLSRGEVVRRLRRILRRGVSRQRHPHTHGWLTALDRIVAVG